MVSSKNNDGPSLVKLGARFPPSAGRFGRVVSTEMGCIAGKCLAALLGTTSALAGLLEFSHELP